MKLSQCIDRIFCGCSVKNTCILHILPSSYLESISVDTVFKLSGSLLFDNFAGFFMHFPVLYSVLIAAVFD